MNTEKNLTLQAIFDSLLMQNQCEDFFQAIQQLNACDVLFGNFEFPCTRNKIPNFINSHAGYIACNKSIELLEKIKFQVLNIAINHIMDWGEEGLTTTRDTLKKFGFESLGADLNLDLARRPIFFESNDIILGFLGYAKKGRWIAGDCNTRWCHA